MSRLIDFPPVVYETADTIRARVDADLNAGKDPSDPTYWDPTVGGAWFDWSQAIILEIERAYDVLGTEIPAAMFPAYAWGVYLDEHGVTINLPRKPAVAAGGTVTFTGDVGTLIPTGTRVAAQQTDPDVPGQTYSTTHGGTIGVLGTLDLPVTADVDGVAGNAPAGLVTILQSAVTGNVASVTNASAITGGTEVEIDPDYRERVLLEWSSPQGAGTAADYERWGLAFPGVGHVTVTPLWNGPGTVLVTITDPGNGPVAPATVTGLQAELDPTPGQGAGLAPIGATVTVQTPTLATVNVAASVVHELGYSLDGVGGSIATRGDLDSAIRTYIDSLDPADPVILNHVVAQFFHVLGVRDVTAVTLNGSAANVTIPTGQVARTGTVNLT